jgi:hypothetical protein
MLWIGMVFGLIVGLAVLYYVWTMVRKLSDDEDEWKP